MNPEHIIRSIIEVALVIPIGITCLLTFIDNLRIKTSYAMGLFIGGFSILASIGGILRLNYSLNINLVVLSFTGLILLYVLWAVKESKLKVIYLFVSAGAIISSIRLFGYLLEAKNNADATYNDVQGWGLILRLVLTAAFMVAFVAFLPKIRWLMNCTDINKIWKIMWLVPFTFAASNIITIPHHYYIFEFGRVKQIYITFMSVLFIMHLLFQFMVYYMAKTITEKAMLDRQTQMLSIQASQYESLQRHIEATSKLRHDFKHTVRSAVSLAHEGNNNALIKLLSDYGVAATNTNKHSIFTKNSSLNALICYYHDQAADKNILCNWQIRLPEKMNIEDIDLFSVVGNLLENAIHAAENETAENRYVNFKADVEENGDIYIVTTNGFCGEIKKDRDKYLSTKKDGSGIGIESIKSVARRYNGFVSFYNDPKTFYADVMLKQNVN